MFDSDHAIYVSCCLTWFSLLLPGSACGLLLCYFFSQFLMLLLSLVDSQELQMNSSEC